MKLLHPFMPFLSEELWHHLRERKEGEDIIIARGRRAVRVMRSWKPKCSTRSTW
jgi:valyl-tRNA synthetase